jgi:hypothetical protein
MCWIKVKCNECQKNYYLIWEEMKKILPADIKNGEAFQMECPICRCGYFGILLDHIKLN